MLSTSTKNLRDNEPHFAQGTLAWADCCADSLSTAPQTHSTRSVVADILSSLCSLDLAVPDGIHEASDLAVRVTHEAFLDGS